MEISRHEEVNSKKTMPITFRLTEKLVNDLRMDSENSSISLNTLVKQILEKYMRWEKYSNKIGLIPMTVPFVREAIDSLPDAKIREIAYDAGKEAFKELVLITTGRFDAGSFISVFNEWLTASHMVFRYEFDGEKHNYVISHDMGEKWSFYISEFLQAICKDLEIEKLSVQIRKDNVLISI